MADQQKPTVLISPLDWGLGHATRCIPVIAACQKLGNVIVASEGAPLALLKEAFPKELFPAIEYIPLAGLDVRYAGSKGNMLLSMIKQSPALLASFRAENRALKNILSTRKIDLIISDNRYGLHHPEVPSVLMTHQLTIKVPMLPMLDWTSNKVVGAAVGRFTECWVPDFKGSENLSGALSHKFATPENTHFIGPLSRFSLPQPTPDSSWDPIFDGGPFDLLMIVSGPEPDASELRSVLTKQAIAMDKRTLLVEGLPEKGYSLREQGKLMKVSHLPSHVLHRLMLESQVLVMRSGYSSLMDLSILGRSALLIPTQGQTEQEYLGKRMQEFGWHLTIPQSKLNLEKQIPQLGSVTNPKSKAGSSLLEKRLQTLLAGS